jgi:phosphoribosylanthranilate isomerase
MMPRARIKFCGMTRREDAVAAVDLGADAIGFVFWPRSPRAITPADAREIARALPAGIDVVGVFVNEPPAQVNEVADHVGLTMVQLHGDEGIDVPPQIDRPVIRAVTSAATAGFEEATIVAGQWSDEVTLLVDAADRERRGGTGIRANWAFARAMTAMRPAVLAGGLSPETVIEAIHTVLPFAVDVSSGVEAQPGVKDRARMRVFADAVEQARRTLGGDLEEKWRARTQFRDALPIGLGRRRIEAAPEMLR